MKRSDWAMVILIVGITALASYFIVGALMPDLKDNPSKVPVATAIEDNIDSVKPTSKVFNSEAIDPTVEVHIGDHGGDTPFKLGGD